MDQDSPPPSDRPKPPPPSLSKPPAAPPPSSSPPAPPPLQASGEPAVKVSVAKGSTEYDKDPEPGSIRREDRPGADAGMPNRVIAALLDGLISGGIAFGVVIAFPWFLDFLGGLLGLAYFLTRDSIPFLEGQSIGKKAMGIRAVTMDGKSLAGNWQPGIVRNVLFLIPFFGALIELIVLITRQDRPPPLLRLGDEWAKTKVIIAGGTGAPKEESGSAPAPAPEAVAGRPSKDGPDA